MEPVTHVLSSLALAQAGLRRTTPLAAPMALVAGLGADADLLSHFSGPDAVLAYHRTFAHSILGTVTVVAAVAALFVFLGRSAIYRKFFSRGGELREADIIRWRGALITCAAAAALHLTLDLLNPYGAQLLWPGRTWYSLDLLEPVDPWILTALAAGLLLPLLFLLVTEEIGAKREAKGIRRGAILALSFVLGYCGARWVMHDRALTMLDAHRYHQANPRRVSAYPLSASPAHWMGIVETDNTFEEIEFRLGGFFDADRSRTNYKPEASPAIEAARATETMAKFLEFARYPSATVISLPEGRGVQVEIRDLRFSRPPNAEQRRDMLAIIELDPQMRITREELIWAKDHKR